MAERIGRYRADRVLGSGAFATVWLAHDEALDAPVAIKVLAENWAHDPDVRRRFMEEARILWQADSERIIRVHTVEELPDGRPYFVMDYADRGSLADRMAARAGAGGWSVDEAVDTSLAIAEGLSVAHSLGIVHRDLKPSNILYQSVGAHHGKGDERLVIADFGIARTLAASRGSTIATGTPHYMAPEQADGRADVRSDLYGAAVILYELLAGVVPFPYDTLGRLLQAQRAELPPPLSTRRTDVPVELEEAIAQALEAEPDRRFSSAAAWAGALRSAAGRPPGPGPVPPAAPAVPPPPPTAPMTMSPEEFAAARASSSPPAAPPPPPPPPPPPVGFAAGPPAGPPRRKKRSPWVPIAVVLGLLAVLAGVAVAVSGDSDSGETAAELFLEPVSSVGFEPFSDDAGLASTADIIPEGSATGGSLDPSGVLREITTVSGDAPGLYGGTNQLSVCDARLLVDFLGANADKAAAFAEALSIGVDEVASYIGGLTDVVLQQDVRVTNHGFSGGRPTPRQAVLETGTAVLVDVFGVPRVRCKCGNPLLPAAPLPSDFEISGAPWSGFDPADVIVIALSENPIEEFVLVDLETGAELRRPPGLGTLPPTSSSTTATTAPPTTAPPTTAPPTTAPPTTDGGVDIVGGELVVTVEWFNADDIDMTITEPGGGLAGFGAGSTSPTGGEYTGDELGSSSCGDPGPFTESVTWSGSAVAGTYTVSLNGYRIACGDGSYRVTIRSGGEENVSTGTLTTGETDEVQFQVG